MLATLAALVIAAPGGLQVKGNQLFYAGKPLTLRGVSVGDVPMARPNRTLDDYRVISRDWGANCVRIGVAPNEWMKKDRKEMISILKKEVKAALDQKMFVLIDWHTIGWPDGFFQIPTWEGADKDVYNSGFALATDFWETCAKEFGKDGRVAFHLWCEPLMNAKDWETPRGSSWPKLRPWFVKLTESIRKKGANNLVIASGNQWAYDLAGIRENLLPDKNTAYEWHVYAGHGDNDPKKWADKLDDLHKVAPVIVSEWGFQADSTGHFKGTADAFGKPFLEFMESRKMHWLAWCWHPTWGPNMLKEDWRTPTEFGQFVKDSLAKYRTTAIRP